MDLLYLRTQILRFSGFVITAKNRVITKSRGGDVPVRRVIRDHNFPW